MDLRFLLLMRHAKHNRGRVKGKPVGPGQLDSIAASLRRLAGSSESISGTGDAERFEFQDVSGTAVLTDQGRYETLAVAKRLGDFLTEVPNELSLGAVFHSESPEARETAEAFCKGLNPFLKSHRDDLEPKSTTLLGPATTPKDVKKKAGQSPLEEEITTQAQNALGPAENAVLFVGHQPAIGWLAEALLEHPVPAAQSELLCLQLDGNRRPRLLWCISPADEDVLVELKEKIKSKMALANLLSAFITAGIGILMTALLDTSKVKSLGVQAPVAFLAAAALGVAVALYLGTMFSYDRLLMPPRFWADTASGTEKRPSWIVARPPSGIHWVLYQNMLRVWQPQFIPATLLVLFGLSLLGSAAFWATWRLSCCPRWSEGMRALTLSIGIPAILPIAFLFGHHTRLGRWVARNFQRWVGPWLGSED